MTEDFDGVDGYKTTRDGQVLIESTCVRCTAICRLVASSGPQLFSS